MAPEEEIAALQAEDAALRAQALSAFSASNSRISYEEGWTAVASQTWTS
jgi:hypothetical protein